MDGSGLRGTVNAALELARSLRAGLGPARSLGPVSPLSHLDLFDMLITHPELVEVARPLFRDGYFARAVEEGLKALTSYVRNLSGLHYDGRTLMEQAFSVNTPVIALNGLRNQSERDEQAGYMAILAGCVQGVRNPRAHDHRLTDAPETAIQLLVMAEHLFQKIDSAQVRPRPVESGAVDPKLAIRGDVGSP